MLFIAAFEFGPGPICWIYMSEVMNDKGVAVGTFLNWLFTLITALTTPLLIKTIQEYTFLGFAIFNFIGSFLVFLFVKETKNLNDT